MAQEILGWERSRTFEAAKRRSYTELAWTWLVSLEGPVSANVGPFFSNPRSILKTTKNECNSRLGTDARLCFTLRGRCVICSWAMRGRCVGCARSACGRRVGHMFLCCLDLACRARGWRGALKESGECRRATSTHTHEDQKRGEEVVIVEPSTNATQNHRRR